ncbi:MAG TPA: DEAD/DEAH box helicase [Vicinamibacterales bacterium]|nr:DEAD/DEAH box helicase [Vicinamibacterales bacterium]
MSLSRFHPLVRRWFTSTLGEPTAAQSRGWASIHDQHHTLIAAPTGSGKTLAAFLAAIDELTREAIAAPLPDEVRVVYVSPLKALSADIHKNLAEPRRGIRRLAEEDGLEPPRITAAVRTGDTSQSERAAMLRTPPHILVTTPESLYLLLTSERSRHMLRSVRTVIVDEIHAVIGTRRGAHLALSLERLQQACDRPLLRIGLSATQKPIEEVARYLAGGADCAIVDEGHRRAMDLGVEIPRSALEAVMAHEVWEEYYDRLAALIRAHRTTLVFVNTRRMAERVARHLSDRLGDGSVTAHHGSLAKETRLDAETRLKGGTLRAIVATASLELGIDIGHVDLVCQIGSPHRIAALLQRVGRSGHTIKGLPKGRVFPTTRDDFVECAALLRAVRRGELDAIVPQDRALDVLAQQMVAECACRDYSEDELFAFARRAWPYRDLSRVDFDAVLAMTADGFSTRRGRRAALLHRDEVNATVRGRRGARLLAQTSGGAIPEIADYRVVLDPGETFVGTLNEDFAIESHAGDIFQLGNASWRILQVAGGTVRVADAHGMPPTIPFWLGEAPARSDELSRAVSDLRADVDARLGADAVVGAQGASPASTIAWLAGETGLHEDPAGQLLAYLAEGRQALGVIPTQQTLVLERFFDESGGMQLVLHAPFGSRINKAWALALRKRFCRQFNFELQAAATEDALMLSLGPQHSFPLSDVFRYLHPDTTRDVLVQAVLDAPVFETRWRWNATLSLAVPRSRGGRKLAPQLQRMLAADLLASVFPDATACLEHISGDREVPDHPLVNQTMRDCLEEAMDFEGLRAALERIHRGDLRLVARDTPEPSVFAYEILNAAPYAFLDDAPLEERRSHAVQTRRGSDAADDLGTLDLAAIGRVREEERPDPRDADDLHDELMTAGFLEAGELQGLDPDLESALKSARRATSAAGRLIAAERLPEWLAIHPSMAIDPLVDPPASRRRDWTRDVAIVEIVRGRLTLTGPTTARALAESLAIDVRDAEAALLALESDGVVLRGRFTPAVPSRAGDVEWCDRALLARIHRYTVHRLRAEIEPVSPADFMRFLFKWQHVDPADRLTGIDGLREAVAMLDGFELAAGAWERSVLPVRVDGYDPSMLDMLCLAGEVAWARFSRPAPEHADTPRLAPATPIALFLREHADAWHALRPADAGDGDDRLTPNARLLLDALHARGASFFADLRAACGLDEDATRSAMGSLVAAGLAASDGFSGLRALVWIAQGRPATLDRRANFAGRWTVIAPAAPQASRDAAMEAQAWTLLRRYGVVSRRVIARESTAAAWRDLARVYRRLEARGEIRGGRFVSGMSGEQFALPRAIERLREVRRTPVDGRFVVISTADPLNLAGVVTAGDRIRAAARNRLLYRDGVPQAVREGDFVRELAPVDPSIAAEISRALHRRSVGPGYVVHG